MVEELAARLAALRELAPYAALPGAGAAGGLGAAFGMAPVFVMIAAVLGVSGYLSSTVKRAGPTPPPA